LKDLGENEMIIITRERISMLRLLDGMRGHRDSFAFNFAVGGAVGSPLTIQLLLPSSC
jgi:hypothetical protein